MAISPTGAAVLSVTVRYRTSDGKEGEFNVDPTEYDAVFWDEAVDRFLLPYYLATRGYDTVTAIKQAIAGEARKTGITIPRHKKICSIVLAPTSDRPPELPMTTGSP